MKTERDLPLVSVLVGCYNHSRFVVETLDSIREQTYPRLELIVWDDASQDGSAEIIKRWLASYPKQAVFTQNTANLGLCKCLNTALCAASGKYVALIAADDVWLPDKIERHVTILENAPPDVGVVYSDALIMDEESVVKDNTYQKKSYPECAGAAGKLFDKLYKENFIPAPTALVRKKCFERVGCYDENLVFEDWDMWLRISREYSFAFDHVPSTKYRVLRESMSRVMHKQMARGVMMMRIKYLERGWLNSGQSREARWTAFALVGEHYRKGEAVPAHWLSQLPRRCLGLHGYALFASVKLRLPHRFFSAALPHIARVEEWIYRLGKCLELPASTKNSDASVRRHCH